MKEPLIGVFVSPRYVQELASGSASVSAINYARAGHTLGCTVFFFSSRQTNIAEQTIEGWYLDSHEVWQTATFPFPHLLYDQAKGLGKTLLGEARRTRRALRARVIRINEAITMGKWKFKKVMEHSDLGPLLPEAELLTSPDVLKALLEGGEVIVKPIYGSRGIGISHIKRDGPDTYSIEFSRGQRRDRQSLLEVYARCRKHLRYKKAIVQRYVPLLRIMPYRRADIRVLMGKDGEGKWQPVSSRMRVAQDDIFLTNTHRGAERMPILDGLGLIFSPWEAQALLDQVHSVAQRAVECLETAYGRLGEVGVDLAFDERLKLWILEANARPDKVLMPNEAKEPIPLLYRSVIEYACYLWKSNEGKSA